MKSFATIFFCLVVAAEAYKCPHGSKEIKGGDPIPTEEWITLMRNMNSTSVTCKEMDQLWPTCGYVVIPTRKGNQKMFADCIGSLEKVISTSYKRIQVSKLIQNFVLDHFDEERRNNFTELISDPSMMVDIYLVPETEMEKEWSKYQSDGLNVGVIVGSGIAIFLIIGIVVVYCCIRKTRQEIQDQAHENIDKTSEEGVALKQIQPDPNDADECTVHADPANDQNNQFIGASSSRSIQIRQNDVVYRNSNDLGPL